MIKKSVFIQAKKCVIDGINFDSQFEGNIYSCLKTCQQMNPSIKIQTQFRTIVRPASNHYSEKLWKVDFFIYSPNKWLLVEAKGQPRAHRELIENIKQLALFSQSNHDNLRIVVPNNYGKNKASLSNSLKVPILFQCELKRHVLDHFQD